METSKFYIADYLDNKETGLSRPSLYKALSDGLKPQFGTMMKVLRAFGGQIRINPISTLKNAPQLFANCIAGAVQ